MKLSEFIKPGRKSVLSIATAIANADIPGLKARSSKIVKALAQHEGMSSEALLEKMDALAFEKPASVKKVFMHASFLRGQLCKVDVAVEVYEFSGEMVSAMQSDILFDDEDRSNPPVFMLAPVIPRLASGGRYRAEVQSEIQAAKNHLDAHVYVMGICDFINSNRSVSEDKLRSLGWEITPR